MKNVPTPGTWVRKQRAGIIPEIILLNLKIPKKSGKSWPGVFRFFRAEGKPDTCRFLYRFHNRICAAYF